MADLHRLAADVEMASEGEGWVVNIELMTGPSGRVYLELLEDTPAEAQRGMMVLRKVVRS